MPAAAELSAWVRLGHTAGIGSETARKLLAAFGLPENIFDAGLSALREVVPERVALALTAPASEETRERIARTLAWVDQPGNHLISLADAHYPAALLNIPDPPVMLYAKGRVELLHAPSLAVVGSRNATAQGMLNAEKFSESLCSGGWTIVSGMALGIDTAAHEGSLRAAAESGAGSTVAVIGTGADIVYPAGNRALAHRIAELGCILSEYPLGMPALAGNFPRRNRLISGLSRGVLVIEAAAQSGSLITARMAAEQGRDVFAIPGSIHSALSKGCHQLIKQGAKLVESAQDILEELGQVAQAQPMRRPPAAHANGAPHDGLLDTMGYDPIGVDLLSERSGLDAAALSARLLTLEMENRVERLPGGAYRRLG